MNFWQALKNKNKPILCLAPMADVTDAAFRQIIAKYSKITPQKKCQRPTLTYVTYTEFVSAEGLIRAPKEGRKKLLKDLEYDEIERPIVAQIFGSIPENIEKAAELVAELGFDGVDINMGCPDRSVEKQGAGAVLMKNPKLAREMIAAAKRGAGELPVSVKTRLGYNKDELETWLPELLAENPAAVILHARTRKEMSKVPARWERVKRAVEIRNEFLPSPASRRGSPPSGERGEVLIIGNGDVQNVQDAYKKCEETGADGAMLGRAVFGNPWLFSGYQPTEEERLKALIEHTDLFEQKFRGVKSFAIMKKHFKSYLHGLTGAKKLKENLMRAENAREVEKQVKDFIDSL